MLSIRVMFNTRKRIDWLLIVIVMKSIYLKEDKQGIVCLDYSCNKTKRKRTISMLSKRRKLTKEVNYLSVIRCLSLRNTNYILVFILFDKRKGVSLLRLSVVVLTNSLYQQQRLFIYKKIEWMYWKCTN